MARTPPLRVNKTAPAAGAATEQPIAVIDAGPAPVDFIRRAQALSAEVIDAGPTRVPAPPPKRPPALPLNPLRAGAAIARGALHQEAAGQVGGLAEADADGGGAPKRPVTKKRAQRTARPAGKKRTR
jgi:hypothetical protein